MIVGIVAFRSAKERLSSERRQSHDWLLDTFFEQPGKILLICGKLTAQCFSTAVTTPRKLWRMEEKLRSRQVTFDGTGLAKFSGGALSTLDDFDFLIQW